MKSVLSIVDDDFDLSDLSEVAEFIFEDTELPKFKKNKYPRISFFLLLIFGSVFFLIEAKHMWVQMDSSWFVILIVFCGLIVPPILIFGLFKLRIVKTYDLTNLISAFLGFLLITVSTVSHFV
jgi:hypothetical protein